MMCLRVTKVKEAVAWGESSTSAMLRDALHELGMK